VEETLVPGASVARVARRHEVNANQVFYWRKLYREGRLGIRIATPILPVKVKTDRPTKTLPEKRAAVVLGNDGNKALERNTAPHGVSGCAGSAYRAGVLRGMIGLTAGSHLDRSGVTDLRKGFTGLSGMVLTTLQENPRRQAVWIRRAQGVQ